MNSIFAIGCFVLFGAVVLAHHGGPHGNLEECFDLDKVFTVAKTIEACKDLAPNRAKRHEGHEDEQSENDKISQCLSEYYEVGKNGEHTIDVENMKKSLIDLAKNTDKKEQMLKQVDICNTKNEKAVINEDESLPFANCFWNGVETTICPEPKGTE